jgi:hypothetical protein
VSLRTENPDLRRSLVMRVHGPAGASTRDTRSTAGPGRIGHPRRRALACSIRGSRQAHRQACLIGVALIAALCGGCGRDKSGATHVSELAGQWTGTRRGGQAELCLWLREDGTFEWRQQQVGGKRRAWWREGRWKPVSLLEEDGGDFTYYVKIIVRAGELDAAAVGPQPGTYEVCLRRHPTGSDWMLRAPWGEFTIERETRHDEPADRGQQGETRDG